MLEKVVVKNLETFQKIAGSCKVSGTLCPQRKKNCGLFNISRIESYLEKKYGGKETISFANHKIHPWTVNSLEFPHKSKIKDVLSRTSPSVASTKLNLQHS